MDLPCACVASISFCTSRACLISDQERVSHSPDLECQGFELPVGAMIPAPVLKAAIAEASLQLLLLLLMLVLNMIKTSS